MNNLDSYYTEYAHGPMKDAVLRPGFVYVVRLNGFSLYKIGVTGKDVARRVRQINNYAPFPVSLVAAESVVDAYYFEELLHAQFEGQRHNREWFRLKRKELKVLLERLHSMRSETREEAFLQYRRTRPAGVA